MNDLTAFQKKILHVLASESKYGLAVKRELEEYYDDEINHGRLYPNLDHLVDCDYVRKKSLDKRTNEYELTEEGRKKLLKELEWELNQYIENNERHADHIREIIQTTDD